MDTNGAQSSFGSWLDSAMEIGFGKSGLTQPWMIERKVRWKLKICSNQIEICRPYNPVCFCLLMIVCTQRTVWQVPKRDGFGTRCDMYPRDGFGTNGTDPYWICDLGLRWVVSQNPPHGRSNEVLKPDNIVYIIKRSQWKTLPIILMFCWSV